MRAKCVAEGWRVSGMRERGGGAQREKEHRCSRAERERLLFHLFLTFDLDGGTGHLARVP